MSIAPSLHQRQAPRYKATTTTPTPAPAAASAPSVAPAARRGRTLLGYLLVPRPGDLVKALLMPLVFGLAVLAAGGVDTRALWRAVIVLIALELLVYAARYQWNDVRGFAADQRHPDAADRGRLPGPLSDARSHVVISAAVAAGRLAVVAALVLLLPGLDLGGVLLWVTVGVFGVAVAYEALRTLGTGRDSRVPPPVRPVLVLLWITVGAGYVVRGLTGLALAVDLRQHVAAGIAAAVALWAYGVAFVTSRWAVEATAFARLHGGRVVWTAEAGQAREHLLALVRWLPSHAGPNDATGSASGWAALRGGTPVLAPWNVAAVVAGAAAALTGRLLTGPCGTGQACVVAVVGAAAALAPVVLPTHRWPAVASGGVVLFATLWLQGAPAPAVALLPWLMVTLAYGYCTGLSLRTMGRAGRRVRAVLGGLLAPVARLVVGRETFEACRVGEPSRG